jgi:hypothetical protein
MAICSLRLMAGSLSGECGHGSDPARGAGGGRGRAAVARRSAGADVNLRDGGGVVARAGAGADRTARSPGRRSLDPVGAGLSGWARRRRTERSVRRAGVGRPRRPGSAARGYGGRRSEGAHRGARGAVDWAVGHDGIAVAGRALTARRAGPAADHLPLGVGGGPGAAASRPRLRGRAAGVRAPHRQPQRLRPRRRAGDAAGDVRLPPLRARLLRHRLQLHHRRLRADLGGAGRRHRRAGARRSRRRIQRCLDGHRRARHVHGLGPAAGRAGGAGTAARLEAVAARRACARGGEGRGQPRRRLLHAVRSRSARAAAAHRRPPRRRPHRLSGQRLLSPPAGCPFARGGARRPALGPERLGGIGRRRAGGDGDAARPPAHARRGRRRRCDRGAGGGRPAHARSRHHRHERLVER